MIKMCTMVCSMRRKNNEVERLETRLELQMVLLSSLGENKGHEYECYRGLTR
jgi:hypothetical protein